MKTCPICLVLHEKRSQYCSAGCAGKAGRATQIEKAKKKDIQEKECPNCKIIHFKGGRFCSQSCSASFNNRKRIWSEDVKQSISNSLKGRPNPRKGIKTGPRPPEFGLKLSQSLRASEAFREFHRYQKPPNWGDPIRRASGAFVLWKEKLSEAAIRDGRGFRLGQYQGRGKKGWYKGYWCDSSFELAYVIYNLEHNLKFERNWERFPYSFEGKVHRWCPDFLVGPEDYVEIKGYASEQDLAKFENFTYKLTILYRKDLKDVFKYVKGIYGENFTYLYEKRSVA